jgi:tripartite-type tricarboxylate transporter receptor subunit TctC
MKETTMAIFDQSTAHRAFARRDFLKTSIAAAAVGAAPALWAQSGTLEMARIITGFSAGGTSDTLCRRLGVRLTGGYARSVVVENRTGAGGQIAIQAMKTLPADGSALLQTPMSMLGIYPHIYKRLQYDPLKDVVPVSVACMFDFGFAVGPMVPATVTTVPQFVAWAKTQPSCSFGSPAAGSVPHFIGVLIGRQLGVEMTHIPYRGTQPAILDMLGGQIPAACGPIGDFLPHMVSGKCRVLAASGKARNMFFPNVGTLTEQGLKDMVFSEWFGIFMPAGASADVVQRANAALRPALASSEVVDGLAAMGLQAASSTPAELAAMLKADYERWGPIVKAIGFTAES